MPHFEKSSQLQDSPSVVYSWHERPGSFYRLIPPWENLEVIVPPKKIENDSEVITKIKLGPLTFNWVGRHFNVTPGKIFCDEIIEGPFASWKHQHIFSNSADGCKMTDSIDYEFPLGRIGETVAQSFTRDKLEKLFSYRHRILKHDLELDKRYSHKKKKILITGATGLVGSTLVPLLKNLGHAVICHGRKDTYKLEKLGIESLDAVIHLAGENIAGSRWTENQKEKILESRVQSTKLLAEAISRLPSKPSTFICASASGFYPESPSQLFDEDSPSGTSFLSEVCKVWEQACEPAREAGIRTLNLRFGMVLSSKGGALKKMLPPFQLGMGTPLGDGKQLWSWICIDDLLDLVVHCLETESLSGAVNASAPTPVSNKKFTETLAASLGRGTAPAVPRFALKLALGEMADDLLLASRGLIPKKALQSGFKFSFPELHETFAHILGTK